MCFHVTGRNFPLGLLPEDALNKLFLEFLPGFSYIIGVALPMFCDLLMTPIYRPAYGSLADSHFGIEIPLF